MSLLHSFRRRRKSASVAKDRLQIIIAQERSNLNSEDYLPMLREEILAVIAKYTKVDREHVRVDLQHRDNSAVLELNVMLPEKETV
ncbi:MAG: cell division topological specificity factor MinE [Gammaproteobacteria bacterium RIFCSPHIGHO2_12_FULL_41_15]|nr:MAG: cell division topological specificity factor MinE [Gammaproteobacteria bacterium RIFCSPHIGHO2_12_FULL_41_15]